MKFPWLECQFDDVVRIFFNSSSSSIVARRWKDFGYELRVPDHVLQEMEDEKLTGRKDSTALIRAILVDWKTRRGNSATLQALAVHLQNVEWNSIIGNGAFSEL